MYDGGVKTGRPAQSSRSDFGARLNALREAAGLTQAQVAKLIGSSQSRVAKMEATDRTVSLDLMIRTLFQLGLSPKQVGRALAGSP